MIYFGLYACVSDNHHDDDHSFVLSRHGLERRPICNCNETQRTYLMSDRRRLLHETCMLQTNGRRVSVVKLIHCGSEIMATYPNTESVVNKSWLKMTDMKLKGPEIYRLKIG